MVQKLFTVLDFTMRLVETGLEDDSVLALVVFSLQHVLVSHEYWKYKAKYVRWKVTLKVHLGSLWNATTWFPFYVLLNFL